jgi:hypothetical protein
VVNYLLTMALNINAYAIVEATNEEEAKKKGADLKFDCNLSPVDNYGKIMPVVPFYYGEEAYPSGSGATMGSDKGGRFG